VVGFLQNCGVVVSLQLSVVKISAIAVERFGLITYSSGLLYTMGFLGSRSCEVENTVSISKGWLLIGLQPFHNSLTHVFSSFNR
jgi:hypothetical protein